MTREIETTKVTTIKKISKIEKAGVGIRGTMTIKILTIQEISPQTRTEGTRREVIEMLKAQVIPAVNKIFRTHQNIQKVDKLW